MAAKERSWVVDFAVYCAVRVVVSIVQALSWSQALALADWLGWLAYRFDRRHREVAAENLRYAFPDKDAAAIDALVRATYRHWARVVIEMIRLPRNLSLKNLHDHFTYPRPEDFETAVRWVDSPRPRLVLSGHFGNFEALSYALGLYGARGGVIARRLDNPYLDRFVRQFRQKTGQEMLDKSLDYERILDILRQREPIGMVGDQDAGQRGLFVEFLGRPASTFKSIALLSLEFQAPIIVMGVARIGDPLLYRVYVEDIILPEEYADHPDPVRAITQRYSDALARMIHRHPEQYFWLHRRWKHQPKVREKKQAA
jgi:KDO2-lipid IV(A) lauroyltransferase